MKHNDEVPQPYVAPFIRRLMKDATEEEILQASENLRQYLLVMYDIYRRREDELLYTRSSNPLDFRSNF